MLNLQRIGIGLLAAAACVFGVSVAGAQDYPTRPINFIVPNTSGNPLDLTPRIMAQSMSETLGQPIVVQNKPGAGTLLGFQYVATQAPADGYNVLIGTTANYSSFPVTVKDVRFDPDKDLIPVIGIASSSLVLASPKKAPWNNLAEMVAYAKAKPGKLNYGSASMSTYLQNEAINKAAGVDIVHIPYESTQANVLALVGDMVQIAFLTATQALTSRDDLKMLVQTGAKRSADFPQVPVMAEMNFPPMAGFGFVYFVRAGTPQPIVDKLYAAASKALKNPDVKSKLAALQFEIDDLNPAQIKASLRQQSAFFADIARSVKLQPQ